MDRLERRVFRGEIRLSEPDGGAIKLGGYIAKHNVPSEDLGGFVETIAPGAFHETIGRDDIRALWNHNSDFVLGRLSAGTLTLTEDETGLAFENTPPDTAWVKDKVVSIRRGDVTGCSFGFYTDEDEWHTDKDGRTTRTLKKVTLVEVSPGVTFPAYPQTDVAVRSLKTWQKNQVPGVSEDPDARVQMDLRRRRLHLQGLALK